MLVRVYSFFIVLYDFIRLLLTCTWAILESWFLLISPPREKSVTGQNVLVIGAGRGIGREIVIQFAALGANVVCWDIDKESNKLTREKAAELNCGEVYSYTCDIGVREEVMKVAEVVREEVGDINILVHCCGIPSPRTLTEQNIQPIRRTIDISIVSHFWILDAFLPQMIKNNNGHIVALTSVAGLSTNRYQVPLCASNLAVQGLVEALSQELRTAKVKSAVYLTLVHIYPFIVSRDLAHDIRMRIPSYFGTMDPVDAASQIISAMRRNYSEISIPRYLLYLSNILRLFPRKVSLMIRDLLDTGIDFG